MKTITMWGYAGRNLGDDLFFQTLIKRYPNIRFIQYAKESFKSEYWKEDNIRVLPTWVQSAYLRLPVSYPTWGGKNGAQVIIGGSIFQDDQNWKRNKEHYQKIIGSDQPVFIIGSNVGPIRSNTFTNEVGDIFQGTQSVTLRDRFSVKLYENLDHVSYVPDLILTRKETPNPISNTLGISVMDLGEAYIQTIAKWTMEAVASGLTVTLFSFSEKLGDEGAIKKIMKRLDSETKGKVQYCLYRGNITETMSIISQMEGMIATRFHSMILGIVFQQNVFSIIYSDKTAHVLADFPHRIPSARVEEVSNIGFEEVLDQMKNQSFDWTETRKQAQDHFWALDQWVIGE